MAEETRKVNVHYRSALMSGWPDDVAAPTLQESLVQAMRTDCGKDAKQRVFKISQDEKHKACLNVSAIRDAFAAEILHLDGRAGLPVWVPSTEPKPVADIIHRELSNGESSLGEPAYVYVLGNHVAVIERLAFRRTNLELYLNELFRAAGVLPEGAFWELKPKVMASNKAVFDSGVKRVIVKPHAALSGEAPSQAPVDKNKGRAKRFAEGLSEAISGAERIIAMLTAAGADETKIETLREAMSTDLVIKAKLELSIASVRRKTTAIVPEGIMETALADLATDGDVAIHSEDGKRKGKLVQLSHLVEVVERDGLLVWENAVLGLSSAITHWAAKGVIDIQ